MIYPYNLSLTTHTNITKLGKGAFSHDNKKVKPNDGPAAHYYRFTSFFVWF